MIRTGILLSITSLLLEVDDLGEFQCSKTASLSVLSFCSAGLRAQNSCKGSWDDRQRLGPFRLSVFSFKKQEEGDNLCLRHNLRLFQPITQALFMFTPSHSAISQIDDVSNWKAWNILEQSMERGSHASTSLGWVPNGKKKEEKKKRLEPVLEEEQRNFLWYGRGSFGRFMAFNLPQSFLEGPGVKSEDRYMGDSCQDFRG